jgi:hypothetical protein
VRLVSVRVVLCEGGRLRHGVDSPSKEYYQLSIDKETKKAAKVHKGCRAIDKN